MTHPPLEHLRAAVTGGTSGLGRALVAELLRRGSRVAFVARHADEVRRASHELRGAHGIVGDISRKDDIYPMALQITGTLGGLDVLVNNASSLGPVPLALLADTDCEDLERALATNLVGPFRLTKALLGSLAASARAGRHPVVVNISSDAAATPYETWGAYGASKAALLHLGRIWDAELRGDGIRLVSIDPGDMDTPLHELAVPGADRSALKRPEDAAREIADTIAALTAGPPDRTAEPAVSRLCGSKRELCTRFSGPSRISGSGAHSAPASRGPQRAVFARWGGRSGRLRAEGATACHAAASAEAGAGHGVPASDEPASLRQGYGGPPKRFARRRGFGAGPRLIREVLR